MLGLMAGVMASYKDKGGNKNIRCEASFPIDDSESDDSSLSSVESVIPDSNSACHPTMEKRQRIKKHIEKHQRRSSRLAKDKKKRMAKIRMRMRRSKRVS